MASSCIRRQKQVYNDAYNKILQYVTALQNEVLFNCGEPTRTQLWRYAKYRQLTVEIERQAGIIGAGQVSAMDVLMEQVFGQTIGSTLSDIAKNGSIFNTISSGLTRQLVDTDWAGSNYSARIWKNSNNLAARLKEDMSDMIIRGKSPNDIRSKLQSDLNVSYNVADRLIRTESAHVYNSATIQGYKASGVKKIKVLIGHDERTCEICSQNAGVYDMGMEPILPAHPNCRCCYAPVIDTTI